MASRKTADYTTGSSESRSDRRSPLDLTGQPAIAVPCGLTGDGLPASISFVGRRWDEASCLRAARAYELVRGEFPAPAAD